MRAFRGARNRDKHPIGDKYEQARPRGADEGHAASAPIVIDSPVVEANEQDAQIWSTIGSAAAAQALR
jgi:hypothetical protein